jgi:hypothetical protein
MRLSPSTIEEAVTLPDWQRFRISLKGRTTQIKLAMLRLWMVNRAPLSTPKQKQIQVQNYLNALARGGLIETCDKELPVSVQCRDAEIIR